MIAGGNNVHAGGKNLRRSLRRNPISACSILSIGNDHIKAMAFAQTGQKTLNRLAAGAPDNIANKQKLHTHRLTAA